MRSLKDKYENFLEEEKLRLARNDQLLQTMEDIDYRAGTLAAKTERLKLLKVSIQWRLLFCGKNISSLLLCVCLHAVNIYWDRLAYKWLYLDSCSGSVQNKTSRRLAFDEVGGYAMEQY